MSFRVRFTDEAREDLERLYDWLLERAEGDFTPAEAALHAIADGISLLQVAPLSCRRATPGNAFLRELVSGYGASGYVALFEVEDAHTVTVLAVRHQREDDYH